MNARCMWTMSIVVSVAISCWTTATTNAQPPPDVRERRRAFVENILRTLVESQTETEEAAHEHDHERRPPGRPVVQQVPVSQSMLRVRRQLAALSESSGQLAYALQREQQYLPQLRPLLADCVEIKATSDVLLRRARAYPNVTVIVDDVRALDRKWRVLKHRLKQTRQLNKVCTDQIGVVDRYATQLCSVLEIQPQFNRQEIIALSAAYISELRHLIQDVRQDIRLLPDGPAILHDCQELFSMCNQTRRLAQTGSYDAIVTNFRACERQWRQLARQLVICKSERARRHVHAIEEIGRQCHDQLWLPMEVDYEFVKDIIRTVDADIRESLLHVTAADLMQCDKPCQAIQLLRDFQAGCHEMVDGLSGNPAIEELMWDFRSLDVQWNDVNRLCRNFPSPALQLRLDNMDHVMSMARQYLGDAPVITQHKLVELCGELDQLAHEMEYRVHQIVTPQRYQPTVVRQVNQDCNAFQVAVHDLHQAAITDCATSHIHGEAKARQVLKLWGHVKARLKTVMAGNCTPQQRLDCLRLRNQLEPLIVKLQVVYET